jgi:hypothetical protein
MRFMSDDLIVASRPPRSSCLHFSYRLGSAVTESLQRVERLRNTKTKENDAPRSQNPSSRRGRVASRRRAHPASISSFSEGVASESSITAIRIGSVSTRPVALRNPTSNAPLQSASISSRILSSTIPLVVPNKRASLAALVYRQRTSPDEMECCSALDSTVGEAGVDPESPDTAEEKLSLKCPGSSSASTASNTCRPTDDCFC